MPRFIIRRTGWNRACWKSKCFIAFHHNLVSWFYRRFYIHNVRIACLNRFRALSCFYMTKIRVQFGIFGVGLFLYFQSCRDFHFLRKGMDFIPNFPRYASVFAVVFPVLALANIRRPIVDLCFPENMIVGIYRRKEIKTFSCIAVNRMMPDHGVSAVNRRSEPKSVEVLAIV